MEEYVAPAITPDDHTRGPVGAPVTIIEYGDYACPYCRGAASNVHRLLDRHPSKITFVFRNFPIPQLHPHAEQAAEAAEASAAQGMFWEMHDLLLQPYSHLDTEALRGYARQLGLDGDRFQRDLAEHTHAARVRRDIDTGMRNGVNSTPKFYVNGHRIDGALPLEGLPESVDAAVAAADDTAPEP